MRYLYHLLPRSTSIGERYAPSSLDAEGFVHTSHRDALVESARLHFAPGTDLVALQIDPRRLDARVELAPTPRGPMPHVHGAIPRDAIVATLDASEWAAAPDRVLGTRFAFVAFRGMTLLDLVGVHDAVSRIATMGFDATCEAEIVSADGSDVWAYGGATVSVAAVRPPLHTFDVVVVAGGHGTRALENDRAVVDWLAAFPSNRLVASVCTGALLLGAAGKLRGKRATTHHLHVPRLAEHGALPVVARLVDEGTVVTAGGVTCSLDLGLHLVEWLEGGEVARKIATQMQVRGALEGTLSFGEAR